MSGIEIATVVIGGVSIFIGGISVGVSIASLMFRKAMK